ncbi:MAG: aldehyde dehydrogenase family protein [Candidatus Riflebacteria bacterium]|nr:aldehyde dehydrogenase family protein [Candidatus Riflebacteria bacterium]
MMHHPILINGEWREASFPVSSFKAVNQLTGKQLPDSFPVSSFLDLDEMLQAEEASHNAILELTFECRAEFLRQLAEELEKNAEELTQTAMAETGFSLKPFLLDQDFSLMIKQLIEASEYCSNRTWREATIDSRNNLRSIRGPLNGPVVIFGPACNPFSLNSCGGNDFACAFAAGNSIIAKSNPGHPLTSYKLARIISITAAKLNFPAASFQFFFNTNNDLGYRLAAHPMIGALAFTGSHSAGLALKESADHAGNLAFINMTGLNPVLILPGAVTERKTQLANELSAAVLANEGQTCKKPGLIFIVENKESSSLIRNLVEEFNTGTCKPLLSDLVARKLDSQVSGFIRLGARKLSRKEFYQPNPFVYPYTVLHLDLKTWLKQASQFQDEAFGPVTIFVTLENEGQFCEALKPLDNCSAISIFSETSGADDPLYASLEPVLRGRSARLCNDRMPGFTAPGAGMADGGSFPASNQPGFTFSGMPAAIKRFTLLQCFDGVKHNRLPADLQSQKPAGRFMRLIDGEYTDQ